MNIFKTACIKIFAIFLFIHMALSCKSPEHGIIRQDITSEKPVTIYIINNNIHTGILIPVINESRQNICVMEHFTDYDYSDFGWGEENVYQSAADTLSMDAKAILCVNSSVVRVEGRNESINSLVGWSDFTVRFSLTPEQFKKLCAFIDYSFIKDPDSRGVITSRKSSGRIIFFRSVHNYHMFNTCNTWVADALEYSGIEVSGSFIITAGRLYKAIKDHGTILKPLP